MRSLAVQVAGRGNTRRHLRPMTRKELKVIMTWSESESPPYIFDSPLTLETRLAAAKHLYMRLWLSLSFCPWTRDLEPSKLRRKDLA
ncbi:hypothetical protein FRB96_008197 [Tulasnella sp. 330]|nr:hypothetical protein FRB96_008197 [Tulasnella sp. 330]KAG8876083.1 hypothetical protein FRB97_004471 [Tulasnella sp. 331]